MKTIKNVTVLKIQRGTTNLLNQLKIMLVRKISLQQPHRSRHVLEPESLLSHLLSPYLKTTYTQWARDREENFDLVRKWLLQ